jgi:S1-C subfamily serine protease
LAGRNSVIDIDHTLQPIKPPVRVKLLRFTTVKSVNISPRRARPLGALALLILAGCSTTTSTTSKSSSTPHGGATASPAPTLGPGAASSLQNNFVQVVNTVTPSVVQISTDTGLGSGIVFDSKGDIVTNNHVVEGATTFTVTYSDGKTHPATLVGQFAPDDLAVIRVTGTTPAPATFADSSKLVVGDIVLAVGNPLGLQSSVSEGIVSAVGRNVSEGNGVTLPDVIQTSAAINPGNSGGALVDLSGAVVGIPTLAAVDQQLGGGAAPGIGFAIPSNTVKDIASQLIDNNGHVTNSHRAYLGLSISPDLFISGALVVSVTPGGPAANAGIVADDVITAIDGQQVQSSDDLSTALAADQPGQKVTLTVEGPDGSSSQVSVTLGELPGS